MYVGVLRIVLKVAGARSLKDRRRVVKSYKDRVRARLPVAVAELGEVESPQIARLGLCTVSGEHQLAEDVMHKARSMAASLAGAVLLDAALEVIPFGAEGDQVRGGIESMLDRKYESD
jgi:uncharacterized protein YlxP (DUF503 family)